MYLFLGIYLVLLCTSDYSRYRERSNERVVTFFTQNVVQVLAFRLGLQTPLSDVDTLLERASALPGTSHVHLQT